MQQVDFVLWWFTIIYKVFDFIRYIVCFYIKLHFIQSSVIRNIIFFYV